MKNQTKLQQRAFDKALKHIRKQKAPSTDNCRCQYKSKDGKSCAFAPMIKKYDPGLENETANKLIHTRSEYLFKWVAGLDAIFAAELQMCHDNAADAASDKFLLLYERSMKRLAAKYNLEYIAP